MTKDEFLLKYYNEQVFGIGCGGQTSALTHEQKVTAGAAVINALVSTLGTAIGYQPDHIKDLSAEAAVRILLEHIGENPDREGLRDTPKRYVKFLKEFLKPEKYELTTFTNEGYDGMVIQSNIPFFSMCEHHMAPFFGTAAIAYIPDKKIVGLSKLARTLDHFARRLQNQERITTQTAQFLQEKLEAKGVAVFLKARHLCVEMRGVEKHDTFTTTSCLTGFFKEDDKCRNEFLKLATDRH